MYLVLFILGIIFNWNKLILFDLIVNEGILIIFGIFLGVFKLSFFNSIKGKDNNRLFMQGKEIINNYIDKIFIIKQCLN